MNYKIPINRCLDIVGNSQFKPFDAILVDAIFRIDKVKYEI